MVTLTLNYIVEVNLNSGYICTLKLSLHDLLKLSLHDLLN